MKERLPRSFATAIYRIIETLGAKVSAQLVRRSTAALYKWSDPDLSSFPTLEQALELDREFMRRGFGPPPILVAYTAMLKTAVGGEAGTLSTSDALRDINELIATASAILRDVTGGQLAAKAGSNGQAVFDCNVCNHLRRLGELVSVLEWKIAQDKTGAVCPLQADTAGKIRCLR
jgi:hypothetical protein